MKQEQVWREFSTLPPTAQQLVMDFIGFLRAKYASVVGENSTNSLDNLKDEPFFGMWHKRSDMQESSEYVRDLRAGEWSSPGE